MPDKKVALNPAQFAEDGGLLDLSLGEVVSLFIDKEKHRHRDAKDDENQQEVVVGYRNVPMGLVMSLDGSSHRLNITRALLTRCVSHQIASWLDSLEEVRVITGLFDSVRESAEEYGYPDLYDGMSPKYVFANTSPKSMSFRTIGWVRNKLVALSTPLGVPSGVLFIVGLCYALTRVDDGPKGTIDKFLSVEVSHFLQCVSERSDDVLSFNNKLEKRIARGVSDNRIT